MKNDKKKVNYLVWVFLIVLSFFLGYFTNMIINRRKVYDLPDSIGVSGVTINLEGTKMRCDFVPDIYSSKITYKVSCVDVDLLSERLFDATVENGRGTVDISVYDSKRYKLILIVDNGMETRNITIADQVYVDLDSNSITVR